MRNYMRKIEESDLEIEWKRSLEKLKKARVCDPCVEEERACSRSLGFFGARSDRIEATKKERDLLEEGK